MQEMHYFKGVNYIEFSKNESLFLYYPIWPSRNINPRQRVILKKPS